MLVLKTWINRARQWSREDITSCNHYCDVKEGLVANRRWLIMSYFFLNESLHLADQCNREEDCRSENMGPRAWIGVFRLQMSPEARSILLPMWEAAECPVVDRSWMRPQAKSWLGVGWKSRSWQRGMEWEEEANVARSVECGQVDHIGWRLLCGWLTSIS